MELCDCNLDEYIRGEKTPPRLIAWKTVIANEEGPFFVCYIMHEIASGLRFIHDHGKVHRDLNPQNSTPPFISSLSSPTSNGTVLYSSKSEVWKIADFGLTSHATTTRAKTTHGGRGKQCYRPPELLCEPKPTFNKMVDIWALGCILYELITGRQAFESDFHVAQFTIVKPAPNFTLSVVWLKEPLLSSCAMLINDTIQLDVRSRPSAKSIETLFRQLIAEHFSTRIDRERATIPQVTAVTQSLQVNEDDRAIESVTEAIQNVSLRPNPSFSGAVDLTLSFAYGLETVNEMSLSIGPTVEIPREAAMYLPLSERENLESLVSLGFKEFGAHHPATLARQLDLAECCIREGRNAQAENLFNTVIEVRKVVLGENDPHTLNTQDRWAYLLINIGRYNEAAELIESINSRCERVFGANASTTVSVRRSLGNAYRFLGRSQDAASLHETLLGQCRERCGEMSMETLQTESTLAVDYLQLGRYTESILLFESTLKKYNEMGQPSGLNLDVVQHFQGCAYLSAQKYLEAAIALEAASVHSSKVLSDTHIQTLTFQKDLIIALYNLERYQEAKALSAGVFERAKMTLGMRHSITQDAERWLRACEKMLEKETNDDKAGDIE